MGKSIMVLNGSPRVGGNTAGLVDAFTKGAKGAGHSVQRFDLQRMDVHPCIGCMAGGKDPASPCTQKDDMDAVYAAFREADVVVLASPLYFWQVTGQLKCAVDRLFALVEGGTSYRYPKRDCVLLMAAEGTGWEETEFWYNRLLKHLGWTDAGRVLASGVNETGDIYKKPELLQAAEGLGAKL